MIVPLFILVTSALVYFIFQNIPSVLEPVVWDSPNPLPKLQGILAPNNLLKMGLRKVQISATNASSAAAKHQLPFNGPECIAFDETNGDAFVSMSDGTVAGFNENGVYKDRIFFTGEFIASPSSLNGLYAPNQRANMLLNWCNQQAVLRVSSWSPSAERLCGRPLGLRFRKEKGRRLLYILDAYHGLFLLDLQSAAATHLVSPHTAIDTLSDAASQLPLMFFNDLDLWGDEVVFSDSSYKFTRSENRREILDGAPRGRLFQYSLGSGRLRLVLCGLHFPNGVQLLSGEDGGSEVLVAESSRFRVLKVNLSSSAIRNTTQRCDEKGYLHEALSVRESARGEEGAAAAAAAAYERFGVAVFYDSAPGIVDNIRLSVTPSGSSSGPQRRFLLAFGSKSTQPFSLLWLGYQTIFLRQLIGKFVPMRLVEHLVPSYGLVVEIDESGRALRSWQDPSGRAVSWISHAERNPRTGALWLGSHSNDFIGILPVATNT